MTEEDREYESAWHLDKKVPVALIVTILLQTSAGVWWASSTSTRLDHVERQVLASSPQADRLTRVEVKLEGVQDGIQEIKRLIQAKP